MAIRIRFIASGIVLLLHMPSLVKDRLRVTFFEAGNAMV